MIPIENSDLVKKQLYKLLQNTDASITASNCEARSSQGLAGNVSIMTTRGIKQQKIIHSHWENLSSFTDSVTICSVTDMQVPCSFQVSLCYFQLSTGYLHVEVQKHQGRSECVNHIWLTWK